MIKLATLLICVSLFCHNTVDGSVVEDAKSFIGNVQKMGKDTVTYYLNKIKSALGEIKKKVRPTESEFDEVVADVIELERGLAKEVKSRLVRIPRPLVVSNNNNSKPSNDKLVEDTES